MRKPLTSPEAVTFRQPAPHWRRDEQRQCSRQDGAGQSSPELDLLWPLPAISAATPVSTPAVARFVPQFGWTARRRSPRGACQGVFRGNPQRIRVHIPVDEKTAEVAARDNLRAGQTLTQNRHCGVFDAVMLAETLR